MATFDLLKADAFSMMSLTGLVEKMDYLPSTLGSMNLFEIDPVRTKRVFVDETDNSLSLIGFTERGAPSQQNDREGRRSITLDIPRLAIEDTIRAHEISNLRESGSETEMMAVQREVNKRLTKMRQKVEYTEEYLRLAAIQGRAFDPADGSVYYNYYTEFNQAEAAAVSFELDVTATDVKKICRDLVRAMMRAARGAWVPGRSRVTGIVGDDFFDALTNHPDVKETWLNWQAAAELRGIDAFSEFNFGGIKFVNYRGSDDNSEIAVAVNEAKFFIEGGSGIFMKAQAPADEYMPFVNTMGQSVYAIQEIDSAFPQSPRFAKYHVHAYPLYFCARPETLRRGTLT